jgi:hypothetical protein
MDEKDDEIAHLLMATNPEIAWAGLTNRQFANDTLAARYREKRHILFHSMAAGQ